MKSWFSGTASAVNAEIIAPFSNAEQIIYKYNQAVEHNSLTQQGWQRLIAQCDDGLASYLTNIKGSTASMSAYSVSLQGSITGYTKITTAMKQYNALGAVSQKEQQNFATAVALTNTKLGSYLTGLNGAKASLSGYGISLIASTAKTVGLTIATTALNAALTFGISAIVTGVISAFATWINSSKKITEAAEEAKDKISSINDDLKTNTETVENAKQRYAELAQEVENLGKVSQGQGSLSTDEYKEFLDLSNQLAGVFPQLTKGYDDNGNAILDLSGSVDTIVGSLDDLLQKEKDLANQKIMDEFPDVYKGYIKDLGEAQSEVKSAKAEFDKVNNAYQQLQNSGGAAQAFDLQGNGTFENADGEQVKVTLAEYEQALKDLGIEYEKTNIMVKNQFGGDTLSGYLINATGDIDTAFTNKLETAKKNLDYAKQQLEGETSSISSYLNTWLQTEFTYNQIDDAGLQTAVQDMIMNFDFSNLPENVDEDNWNEVSEYLRRNILFAINDVQDDPDISNAISEVFTNQDLTPDEKADYLQQIKDYFDNELGKDNAISISLQPQIDDTDALQKNYENTINRFKTNEESNLEELKQSYQEAIDKRKELYSGTDYVGNVDINNRPVVINDDGSYSTTSTSFQEKWVGDEENGHYIIAHFTPILPDGTVLDDDSLNEYIDKILNSADPMEADKVENGGKGILYKVDTQINGKDITDDNLEDAFGVADAWDVDMHNLQDKMYKDEAAIKAQIAKFDDGVDGSQKIKDFFDTEGINIDEEINEFNEVTKGINDADKAIQKWNEHKKQASSNPDLTSLLTESDDKSKTATLADLKSEADLMQSLQSEIAKTGNIGVDSMQKIIKQFPEAKQYLADYMSGLITEQELFSKLENVYAEDTQQYINSLVKKNETDADFFTNVKNNNETLFNGLAENYGFDIKNWNNLAKAKLDVDKQLMAELASIWTGYYTAQKDSVTGLYTLATNPEFDVQDDSDLVTPEMEEARVKQMAIYDKYNQIIQSLNDAAGSFAKTNIDLDWNVLGKDDSSSSSSSSKDTKEKLNWIERLINKISTAYSRLKNVVSDTTRSWSTRNNALIQSQQELTRQINLQSQAYEYYMQLFNALDLDDYYKKLIMDGAMLVETITDPDLLEVINKAIELFDKAEEAKNNISSMTAELHELSTQLFDNTAKEFQGKINVYEHAMKTLENGVSLIETKGYKVTASLYEEMIAETQDRISLLEQERSALESAMASADVEVGSEAWMDMYNQILDVDNAIQEATISLAEFNNELRQLKWDKFDDIQSGIQETIDEAEFMYKLLENRGLTNDTGGLNDNGIAAQGLLAEKYNLYMAMADKYAKEVKAIDAELANDPGNTKLLERRQELLKAQREAILNAEDEKESIKDLIEESYNKLGDTISDLISKYKDFIQTIKDTYDYEQKMSDKTKELADLQKQYAAVKGDNSEEGMSRRQQLEDQIKDKQDDIQQTEYEKLISDTEALLDKFNSEYQEWLTNLVTELETTLQMAIDQTNQYSDQILATLNDQAYGVGYTLSEATTSVFSSIGDSVAMYGQGFLDSANGINSSIMLVENAVEAVYNAVQAQAIAQQAIAQAQAQIAGAMMGGGSSGSQSAGGDALSGQNDTGSGGGNSIGVGSIMTLKDGSSYWETSWGNGRSGSKYAGVQGGVIIDEMSIAGLVDGGENDPNAYGDHYVHIRSADGVYRDLGWVRWEDLEQYASGTNHAKGDWAWTQEKGSEIIRTSDGAILTPVGKGGMVFNNESSKNLYELSQDPISYFKDNMSAINPMINVDKYIPTPLTNNSKNGDVNMGGVNFSIGQIVADNPQEFVNQLKQVMASDTKVQKMVQEITLGQSLGNNSLNARRYL